METAKHVVIIEDEREAAELFAEMMRVSGYSVSLATNSKEGLALLQRTRPDVVVLDIMMPDISGMDVLKTMRAIPHLKDVPVVIVSAKSTPADIRNGLAAGAQVYLTKPVGFQELKTAVAKVLQIA
jgi:two-component system alkaline phosphatase synthesis response regulator PhoP